jgi:hypothetical protein
MTSGSARREGPGATVERSNPAESFTHRVGVDATLGSPSRSECGPRHRDGLALAVRWGVRVTARPVFGLRRRRSRTCVRNAEEPIDDRTAGEHQHGAFADGFASSRERHVIVPGPVWVAQMQRQGDPNEVVPVGEHLVVPLELEQARALHADRFRSRPGGRWPFLPGQARYERPGRRMGSAIYPTEDRRSHLDMRY